jgi:hypothetical protein
VKPRRRSAAKASTNPQSWSSEWVCQLDDRCTTCEHKRPVMLVEDSARVCSECHEARLQKWRLADIEAERRETQWTMWDLAAAGRL